MSLLDAARSAGESVGRELARAFSTEAERGFNQWEREQSRQWDGLRATATGMLQMLESAEASSAPGREAESPITPESIRRAYDRG